MIMGICSLAATIAAGQHVLEGYEDVARELAWQPAGDGRCAQKPQSFECTRTQQPRLEFPHAQAQHPCRVLSKAGVQSIAFYGDSFVRHVFQATALFLSRDYQAGSVEDGATKHARKILKPGHDFVFPDYGCDFDGQFADYYCRVDGIMLKTIDVCTEFGGNVTLSYLFDSYTPIPRPTVAEIVQYDVVVWGFGNHWAETDQPHPRDSKNNASYLGNDILKPTCRCEPFTEGNITDGNAKVLSQRMGFPWTTSGPGNGCIPWHTAQSEVGKTVIWLHNHFRPIPGSANEDRATTYQYSQEMPKRVKEICGVMHSLETFNWTKDLVIASMIKSDYDTTLSLFGEGGSPLSGTIQDQVQIMSKDKLRLPHKINVPPYAHSSCVNNCFDMERDGGHWGLGVNLIKAHLLVQKIARMKGTSETGM
jgi:hypothetical protein